MVHPLDTTLFQDGFAWGYTNLIEEYNSYMVGIILMDHISRHAITHIFEYYKYW